MRLFLGAVEAGLFPGLAVYLTFFYTKKELAVRIGYLFVSAALAGGFGGLLAYGIGHMDGVAGQSGWRWFAALTPPGTQVLTNVGSSLSKAFRPCLWESQHSGSCPTTPKR
ncbi:MAG: hypothetical protein CL912_26905 [Deltaproteobacteria bacterium]|nr:hypothetical protein [Deltaproteobacteria bacterium]